MLQHHDMFMLSSCVHCLFCLFAWNLNTTFDGSRQRADVGWGQERAILLSCDRVYFAAAMYPFCYHFTCLAVSWDPEIRYFPNMEYVLWRVNWVFYVVVLLRQIQNRRIINTRYTFCSLHCQHSSVVVFQLINVTVSHNCGKFLVLLVDIDIMLKLLISYQGKYDNYTEKTLYCVECTIFCRMTLTTSQGGRSATRLGLEPRSRS